MIHSSYEMMNKYTMWDYRCDDFKKEHDGKHIVFLGDSFAAGDSLEKEDTWCYKVYKKISEIEKTSGYFNLGSSGAAISECVDQLFKYCFHYSNPDVVFFITTEFHRENRYAIDNLERVESFVHRNYLYLEQYCRSNNIQLYSFSWAKSIGELSPRPKGDTYISIDGNVHERPSWTWLGSNQESDYAKNILLQFETFYDYQKDYAIRKVFEFDSKTKTKEKSLWAADGSHPGTSFHDFYADFIFTKYLEKNK